MITFSSDHVLYKAKRVLRNLPITAFIVLKIFLHTTQAYICRWSCPTTDTCMLATWLWKSCLLENEREQTPQASVDLLNFSN